MMFARALDNKRLIALFSTLLIVAGLASYAALPTTEDPRVMNRVATVLTPFPGATAERVEALITEPIEDEIRTLPEVDVISSSSQAGISVIRVELKDTINEVQPVWAEVRDKLSEVEPLMPQGALPIRLDDDRGYAYTRLIALTWTENDPLDLGVLGRYSEDLARQLRAVPGMDLVRLYGEGEEEILVDVNLTKAASAGLGVSEIATAIRQRDAKVSAGQLRGGDREWLMEVSGELDSINDLGATVIRRDDDGSVLRLHDVADVRRSLRQPVSELTLIDGQRSVVVAARMLPDVRIGDWTRNVDEVLESFSLSLPANIEKTIIFDQQVYTNDRLGGLVINVLMGFAVILSVLFVTLGWRAALVVALTLPLTVGFTLVCMGYFGLPIHQMSVTGLVVALGIMVDNAIVMTDTIQRLMREGAGRLEAVQRAIRHLWIPLAGSTMTTILAFMPIAIMPGPAGEFVGGIAISVIFALIGSYLVSHTLIAGIGGRFLRARDTHTGINLPALTSRFKKILDLSLKHPRTSIAVALVLPMLGFMAMTQMPEQFFPPSDRDMFNVEVYLEPAASLANAQALVDRISPRIEAAEGVERVQWFLGGSAPPFYYNLIQSNDQTPNFAQAMVNTSDFESANRIIPQLQEELDEAFPEAQILVRMLEQGPPFNAPVEVRIFGPNLDRLSSMGESIKRIALMTEDVIHVRESQSGGRPKARLEVDESQVRRAGLAPAILAAQLEAVLDGVEGGTIMESTEELPVRLRIGEAHGGTPEDLGRLHLAGVGDQSVLSLTSLGEIAYEPAAGAVSRRQGQRVNTVEIFLRAGVLPAVVQERIETALAESDLVIPPGYRLEFGGEGAERDSAVGNLMANVGLILILLVITVVLSFNSFRISLIIFSVAGLSIGLGLLCVWAFGYPFGFQVIVGLMGLMGLAINAAIVILAELKSNPQAVTGQPIAIRESVMNCTRHIGSTTLTTLGGFMPLILAGGGFWPPFAIAIAGGTVLTSVLSFLLVPAAFRLFTLRRHFDVTGQQDAIEYSENSDPDRVMPQPA